MTTASKTPLDSFRLRQKRQGLVRFELQVRKKDAALVRGRSNDGGIDLLGTVRLNNVLSFRILAQCKRYKDTVGPSDIRNFRGAMQGRTDKGIFITSGRYTSAAYKEASRDGVPSIDLVDGSALAKLLKDLKMGVETRLVERVIIKPDFFNGI